MRSARIDNKVELTKTMNVSGDVVRVTYRITPSDDSAEQVQLVETLPEPIPRSAITCSAHDDGHWEFKDDRKLVFVNAISDAEPIRATLRIESPTLDPEDCVSAVTLVSDGPRDHYRRIGPKVDASGSDRAALAAPPPGEARPAIGLVATDERIAAVAQTAVRAIDSGLSVYVAVADEHGTAARIGERLGATVVRLDTDGRSDDELAAELDSLVRKRGHPGLVFCGTCHDPVAIEESVAAFEASPDSVVDGVQATEATSVLVGIPAYNESETVGEVVAEAADYADEVLVVDDGSTDGTADRAREAAATVVEHDRNRGYGHTLQTIFVEADKRDVDVLVTLDADGQHDPADVRRIVEKQRETTAEIVIGSRFDDDSTTDIPSYRRFGLRVITLLTNVSIGGFGHRIRDPQSGFRSYDATAIASLAAHTDAMDDSMSASIDILSVAHAQGFTTVEVPISISYDVENPSTRNPITHGMTLVNKIRKTLQRDRPVAALGIPGICLVLTGVGLTHWTLSNYLARGTVSLELTLLSALLVLTGLLSSFLSVVRHSLNTHLDSAAWLGRN